MKVSCPVCNAAFPLEAALADNAAREAVRAALALPAPLGDRVLRYLGLFRPATKVLSWERAARLLLELMEPIQAARVERSGRTWTAPLPLWEVALDEMLEKRDRLQLPLKSHGYLFEIVAGLAGRAEGAQEAREIERARTPYRPLAKPEPVAVDPKVRDAAMSAIKNLVKGGGA